MRLFAGWISDTLLADSQDLKMHGAPAALKGQNVILVPFKAR